MSVMMKQIDLLEGCNYPSKVHSGVQTKAKQKSQTFALLFYSRKTSKKKEKMDQQELTNSLWILLGMVS